MLIYQVLYYAQLIVFQGGGRFQSLTDVRAFPAQSARLCLIRFAQSQSKLRRWPLIPLWKTSRCATLSIPSKVKLYDQVKTTKRILKALVF